MASLNNCAFIGNVGKIETRYTSSGDAVTNISLAVNEVWKTKEGEKKEKCEWVNCVLYKKLAEIAAEYVKVGASVYLSGKLSTRKWQTKEGQDKWSTEIIVNEFQMLSKVERKEEKQESLPEAKYTAPVTGPAGSLMDMADDLPFLDPYKFCWRSV